MKSNLNKQIVNSESQATQVSFFGGQFTASDFLAGVLAAILAVAFPLALSAFAGGDDGGSSVGGIGRVKGVMGTHSLLCTQSPGAHGIEFSIQGSDAVVQDLGLTNNVQTKVSSVNVIGASATAPSSSLKVEIALSDVHSSSTSDVLNLSLKDLEELSSNSDLERGALLVRKAQGGASTPLTCRVR